MCSSDLHVAASLATDHDAPALLALHAVAIGGHNDDSGTSRAPCLKVCDDGSRSAPKAFSGIDQGDPGPAPVAAAWWTTAMAVGPTPRRVGHLEPTASGLPIRVLYARLAL